MENQVMKEADILKRKICLIGYYGSGKSSLINRFVNDKFDESYKSSIGVTLTHKTVICNNKTNSSKLNLLIWDLEGEGQSSEVPVDYFQGASGAIIVTDLKREETIEAIPELIEKFKSVSPNAKIVLAGNKVDLCNDGFNGVEVFKEKIGALKFKYFLTSAKTNENVEECFSSLAEMMIQ